MAIGEQKEGGRVVELSYYDHLLRTIAQREKRSEGQWNRLIQESLNELNTLIDKEGTTYDSTVMLSFEEYKAKLTRVAKEKLGIEIQPTSSPNIILGATRQNTPSPALTGSSIRNDALSTDANEKRQVRVTARAKR